MPDPAPEPSLTSQIGRNTLEAKLGLWADNFRVNLPVMEGCQDIMTLPKVNGPALCVGNGPSLPLHIDRLKEFRGTVLSCERNLVPLLEHGVIPDYVVSIDGDPLTAAIIDHPLVDRYAPQMTGVFTTTCHPQTVQRWQGKRIFFNAWMDDLKDWKSVSLVFNVISQKATMQTGGNCGATLWFLARFIQVDPVVMVGIDFAYPATGTLDQSQIWKQICHLPREGILGHFCRGTSPLGQEHITDACWDGLSSAFTTWIEAMPGARTIQCSDYTHLEAPSMVYMKFDEYLAQQDGGDHVTVLRPEVVKVGGGEQ